MSVGTRTSHFFARTNSSLHNPTEAVLSFHPLVAAMAINLEAQAVSRATFYHAIHEVKHSKWRGCSSNLPRGLLRYRSTPSSPVYRNSPKKVLKRTQDGCLLWTVQSTLLIESRLHDHLPFATDPCTLRPYSRDLKDYCGTSISRRHAFVA